MLENISVEKRAPKSMGKGRSGCPAAVLTIGAKEGDWGGSEEASLVDATKWARSSGIGFRCLMEAGIAERVASLGEGSHGGESERLAAAVMWIMHKAKRQMGDGAQASDSLVLMMESKNKKSVVMLNVQFVEHQCEKAMIVKGMSDGV